MKVFVVVLGVAFILLGLVTDPVDAKKCKFNKKKIKTGKTIEEFTDTCTSLECVKIGKKAVIELQAIPNCTCQPSRKKREIDQQLSTENEISKSERKEKRKLSRKNQDLKRARKGTRKIKKQIKERNEKNKTSDENSKNSKRQRSKKISRRKQQDSRKIKNRTRNARKQKSRKSVKNPGNRKRQHPSKNTRNITKKRLQRKQKKQKNVISKQKKKKKKCKFNNKKYKIGKVVLEDDCVQLLCEQKGKNKVVINTYEFLDCQCPVTEDTTTEPATTNVQTATAATAPTTTPTPISLPTTSSAGPTTATPTTTATGSTTTGSTTTGSTTTGSTTTATGSTGSITTTTAAPTTTTAAPTTTTAAPTTTTAVPTTTTASSAGTKTCADYQVFTADHSMCKPQTTTCTIKIQSLTAAEKTKILQLHNSLREKVAKGLETLGSPGPQPAGSNLKEMVWNDEIASVAQAWSNTCPSGHDCADCRKITDKSYYVGQNIYYSWGFDSSEAWDAAVNGWYDEVKDMPNTIVDSFQSVSGPVIGHYTQVVWAESNEIGCGKLHHGPCDLNGTSYNECKIYVCNYGPGGNILSQPIYKRGTAASDCTSGASSSFPGLCS